MKLMAALDFSDYAQFVLIKAIKTARQQSAKMDIMVVAETHGIKPLKDAEAVARSYQALAIAQGIKAKVRARCGESAAEEILKYQKSENLDLIVIGRSSRQGLDTSGLGAVAEKVVTDATCTVMVVRRMGKQDLIKK